MRVDPDTSIHDLTDTEAADLRALCEVMLRGPVSLDHPLFVRWAQTVRSSPTAPAALLSVAFLPRALHALLRRAHEDGRAALAREQAAVLAAVGPIAPHPDMLREFSEPDLHAELARRANARKRALFGGMP